MDFFWIVIVLLIYVAFMLFIREKEKQDARNIKAEKEEESKRHKANAASRKANAIRKARDETEALVKRGAIFEITNASGIRGYLVKELGWVSCECDERSVAEKRLRQMAAEKYKSANTLTKLTFNFREERYQAGTGPQGNPYYRNRKIKIWEAMACEAIANRRVDKSPVSWNHRVAVVDGSNVAHWAYNSSGSLKVVNAILEILKREGVKPLVVFDANIGYKVANRHLEGSEVKKAIENDVYVEIVQSGTIADRRIVELAEKNKAIIVSNDLFRDSLRARPIPKRRGFFLPEYDYAELLDPRP